MNDFPSPDWRSPDGSVQLYNTDSSALLPLLPGKASVVSDPPYGVRNKTNYSRLARGHDYRPVLGDDRPFDPTPLLRFPKAVLWGSNNFSHRLPPGALLVWLKKRITGRNLGRCLSDCEVAWCSRGCGVWFFHHVWCGFDRQSERGRALHPTQKPVALMRWCIDRLRLKPGSLVVDPFMGSGATAIAAVEAGMRFVGFELDSEYFGTSVRRLNDLSRERERATPNPGREILSPSAGH